jgi:uncharacterized protein with von Willebrand factor type A (vWA) domain
MVEPTQQHVNCRFFPINDTHSFVQYEVKMTEKELA